MRTPDADVHGGLSTCTIALATATGDITIGSTEVFTTPALTDEQMIFLYHAGQCKASSAEPDAAHDSLTGTR